MGKYLIVGCGLSGSVIGRELAEDGHDITIWDRRDHIGGNMYDYLDEHGIIVHKYGPHCFHTNNKALYDYMCRYNQWRPFRIFCQAEINGKATPSPFNFQTIDDFYTKEINYLRLRNLVVGYSLPQRWTQRAYIQKLRLYFEGSNLSI